MTSYKYLDIYESDFLKSKLERIKRTERGGNELTNLVLSNK